MPSEGFQTAFYLKSLSWIYKAPDIADKIYGVFPCLNAISDTG